VLDSELASRYNLGKKNKGGNTMKHYNYNSIKNLAIKDQFVQREVIANISDMAEHLDWDEWENLYVTRCPKCGETVDEWEEVEGEGYKCPHCGAIHEEEPEPEPQEIYEYWIVTPYLGEQLREKGEPILEHCGGWIWGRTCTGQAISLDSVISSICYEMGILEGQPHEWKI